MSLDELIRAVCADPADDAPRLAYADTVAAIDPARAELIRIQIERFRREEAVGALVRNPGERERILLTCHGATWAREVAPYTRPWGGTGNVFPAWDFDRGFVAAVGASATVVADKDCPLPRLAPIEHLSLTGPGPYTAALTAPWLAQIRSLTATHLELGDDDAIALAQRGHLDRWSPGRATSLGLARPTTLRSSLTAVTGAIARCIPGTRGGRRVSAY
ncbi:MAG: TIGR02996 domain-containing protein [Gordonia sp.]|uniref:TIGR02996 domain-containing protein n=1 Tax=Gordonia sp. (in: high G+C Gram-positive bacteria) TaxID=84139 RepID=UPI001DBAC941|nr:TIGR02996 domain-containing protein [Gordonia sp. (in: high G+C Gram-positive bacteria)]MCB1295518.1 TIGR02996 domain-containing protein [Gordonia sp. (in: high G+C Gram-positive bacteria)]